MNYKLILLSFLFVGCSLPPSQQYAKRHTFEYLSPTRTLDQVYPSMNGPEDIQEMTLWDSEEPEVLWLLAHSTQVVDDTGQQTLSNEYLCHTNIDVEANQHNHIFQSTAPNTPRWFHPRLFTLSQGATSVVLPDGYGVPVRSDVPLTLLNMFLSHKPIEAPFQARQRFEVQFIRDAERTQTLKPLYLKVASVLVSLEDQPVLFNREKSGETLHDSSCSMGVTASELWHRDSQGRKYTPHWYIEPGRSEYKTLVTDQMALPVDTTLHYIGAHVHGYAESIVLKDLTTGKVLFRGKVTTNQEHEGVESVEVFSSKKGLRVYKDHEYEMSVVYNNTSGKTIEGMAMLYIYFYDALNPLVQRRAD